MLSLVPIPNSFFARNGQTNFFGYNSRGQVTSVTNALQEVVTLSYDTNGYALGFNGDLVCVNRSDGQPVWKRSYTNDFAAPRPGWGFTDYPLIDGDKLICRPGGSNATMVALNKRTGEMIWKLASAQEGTAGYGATIVVETAGFRQYVATFQKAHVAVNANNGSLAWRYPGVTSRYGSSYTPHIKGDLLLCQAGYGGGLAALRLQRAGDQINTTEVYQRRINFDPFQDCAVLVGEHLYSWSAGVGPICHHLRRWKSLLQSSQF